MLELYFQAYARAVEQYAQAIEAYAVAITHPAAHGSVDPHNSPTTKYVNDASHGIGRPHR